ncbi:MAG: efflux RND transporter periplasmic adaptor subunit [Bradyrhizobiaceae bacterium]|nr:efflux RND transporter periplasmic adaptor subunit [Bradyrhizobiaceae bacterium]
MIRSTMIRLVFACCLTVLFVQACNPGEEHHDETTAPSQKDVVTFTEQQLKSGNVKTVNPSNQAMQDVIRVFGALEVPPQNLMSVNAALGGTVRSVKILPGEHVRKGQALLVLESAEFIRLQEEYLTVAARMVQAEATLKREQILAADNINARKTLEQAEADLKVLRIRKKAIQEQLALVGINTAMLTSETLSRSTTVTAPFDGYVTEVFVNSGTAVGPTGKLLELVNPTHMHVELRVFERDAAYVKDGQPIRITIAGESRARAGHVHLVGTEIGADKTVLVHAHLDTPDTRLKPGTSVTASIVTTEHQALTVPESAILSSNSAHWVFVRQSPTSFRRVRITKGTMRDGVVAVDGGGLTTTSTLLLNARIATVGTEEHGGHAH